MTARTVVLLATLAALAFPGLGLAKGHGGSHHSTSSHSTSHKTGTKAKAPTHQKVTAPASVKRTSDGKIHRDPKEKAAFRRHHPCPSTGKTSGACPGYEVDHVKPLACGGADSPVNMQWLTTAQNRSKGSQGCRR